jgi:hypothetical protein
MAKTDRVSRNSHHGCCKHGKYTGMIVAKDATPLAFIAVGKPSGQGS